jgi:fluoroacetyl-CoA thioesterase
VTPDMTARIDGREIHAVYGTVPLVAHVEQVCRTLLEPHLEDREEGVGARIELLHRAPVPVGARISLVATVASVAQDSLTCEILVRHGGSVVARGSFEQRIVPIDAFRAEVEARRRPAPQAG